MTDADVLLAADMIEEQADPGGGFRDEWRKLARPEQIPPPGRYRTFLLIGGRGAGKTWTGSHTLAEWILADPEAGEWGIVAPTYPDAWSVCVEGESGFLAALGTTTEEVKRGKSKLVEHWHRSFAEIKLRSGHIIRVASAQDGGLRIQGKNLKGAWCIGQGEPVRVPGGTIPVEGVRPGDLVATRQGWRRVLASGMTRADAPVIRVTASDGSSLRCTDDHPVWTAGRGWIAAGSLNVGDRLLTWNNLLQGLPPGSTGTAPAGTGTTPATTSTS